MQNNKKKLKERFPNHPHPVMHGVVNALFSDSPTGCVLLGQRNVIQVEVAATLGNILSDEEHYALVSKNLDNKSSVYVRMHKHSIVKDILKEKDIFGITSFQ